MSCLIYATVQPYHERGTGISSGVFHFINSIKQASVNPVCFTLAGFARPLNTLATFIAFLGVEFEKLKSSDHCYF